MKMCTITLLAAQPSGSYTMTGYWIGGVLALFILGYLFYALARPEKL